MCEIKINILIGWILVANVVCSLELLTGWKGGDFIAWGRVLIVLRAGGGLLGRGRRERVQGTRERTVWKTGVRRRELERRTGGEKCVFHHSFPLTHGMSAQQRPIT